MAERVGITVWVVFINATVEQKNIGYSIPKVFTSFKEAQKYQGKILSDIDGKHSVDIIEQAI